jgi:hypothetical protein
MIFLDTHSTLGRAALHVNYHPDRDTLRVVKTPGVLRQVNLVCLEKVRLDNLFVKDVL